MEDLEIGGSAAASAPGTGADTTPTPSNNATEGSTTTATPSVPSWRSAIRGLGDEIDKAAEERTGGTEEKPAGEGKGSTTPTGQSAEGKGAAPAKPDAPKEGEPDKAGAEPKGASRFQLVGADGADAKLELPEGAKITFKADGRPVSVSSVDDLVQLAQKGVHADRKLSEQGRTAAAFRQHAEAQIAQAETLLRKVITDPEAFRKVEEYFDKLEDPDYRQKAEDSARLARIEAEQNQASDAAWEETIEALDAKVEETIDTLLEGDEFPHLVAEDADDVGSAFEAGFLQHQEDLVAEYRRLAPQYNVDPDAAEAQARQDALQWLTEANLKATLKQFNDRYARRGAGGQRGGQDPARAAEEHNRRTTEKLSQRDTSVGIRGNGGGFSSGGERKGEAERPSTFQSHMSGIRGAIRSIGGG